MDRESTNRNLLDRWKQGDEFAAQILVDRYMVRLTALAKARLSRKLARRLDPEDIVLSAWRSFFVATRGGRIEVPEDDNLWPLLLTMTLRKLQRQAARHQSEKRAMDQEISLDTNQSWMSVVSTDPTPEEAALVIDDIESLLQVLDQFDRDVLVRRLQGLSSQEIAKQLNCSDRTVRRVLVRIREVAHERLGVEDAMVTIEPRSAVPNESLNVAQTQFVVDTQTTIPESDFLLQQFVGRGGFGKVYRALDRRTQQTIAVKFLSKRLWQEPAAIESFQQEISALSNLSHPGIVQIGGCGRTSAGAPYFVMEYIDGTNLSKWATSTSPTVPQIIHVASHVARAVAAAHSMGIIHADLTPSNVLLERDTGRIVLTDFGLSRMSQQHRFTTIGGTPGFLAPEQLSDAFGEVTTRTDVYGIGSILYALLTGHAPMTGPAVADIIANVLSSRRPVHPTQFGLQVAEELSILMFECLDKEPSLRPVSADAVAARLSEVAEKLPLQSEC